MEKSTEFEGVDISEVYFKLNPEEAIGAKKDILEAVAAILRMEINAEKYKKLSQEVNRKRIGAKKEIDELKRTTRELIEKELPSVKSIELLEEKEEKRGEKELKKVREKAEEKKEEKRIKQYSLKEELEEIQKRLERL